MSKFEHKTGIQSLIQNTVTSGPGENLSTEEMIFEIKRMNRFLNRIAPDDPQVMKLNIQLKKIEELELEVYGKATP